MGLNLAPTALNLYFYTFLISAGFILIPLIIFWRQKKDLKYEIRHRFVPNDTLYRNKNWGFRLADISFGVLIGIIFYIVAPYLSRFMQQFVAEHEGPEFVEKPSLWAGSP